MEKMTEAQVREKYGADAYLVVCGTLGDKFPDGCKSEEEAVRLYEEAGGKAACIIVCVPSETHGRLCYRGWIDDTKWKWHDDGDSLAIDPIRPKKRRGRTTCRADVENACIVVTDPAYLLGKEGWNKLLSTIGFGRALPQRRDLHGLDMLLADTIYGDWLCELRGSVGGSEKTFGKFTADSGMVCVAINPDKTVRERLRKLRKMCWTRITRFTGRVEIVHRRNTCYVHGIGRSNGAEVEFASYQIG